jgi:nitroimidazol reductase NimA-like FMN-containing flavoprotein (pyridoxamine 5'-phosphate oxidase superfamily)
VDVEQFLSQPLVARLAVTGKDGYPTVRPVWFLFEDERFWWLTGSSYSRLRDLLAIDRRVSLVVDSCDLITGQVLAVSARGEAVVHALDSQRAVRKLTKYLGPARELWPSRFKDAFTDPTTRLVSLQPSHQLVLRDMSFEPPAAHDSPDTP